MKSISIFVSNDFVHDQRMNRISKAFTDLDWKVQVYATLKEKSLPLQLDGTDCTRLLIVPTKGVRFYAKMNWKFFIKAFYSKSDFILSVDVDTLLGLRLAAVFKNKPLIWDCHEIFTEMPELHSRPRIKKVWYLIEKIFGSGLSRVITSTKGVAEYLRTTLGINAKVIHNYPNPYPLKADIYQRFNSKIILFQGILNEGRCLPELIHAMNLLPREFSLLIAGDGHLRSFLEQIVHKEDLVNRVKFTGMLTPEELIVYTSTSCLGVSFLDKAHINSQVSLANKNLDYIMAGLPCVTVNLPEYASINQKWEVATLIDDVNTHSIAKAIRDITTNFENYNQMHIACMEARKYLNWELEVKKLNDFIQSL